MLSRSDAEAADAADPLRAFRDEFDLPEGVIYLDGNSLGPPSKRVLAALDDVQGQWARELVTAWDRWIDLPLRVGDRLGETLLGAAPDQVAVCDSTTVNLYKLIAAARTLRPERSTIAVDAASFPTDRYIADQLGSRVREVDVANVDDSLDNDVAAVVVSAVDYRTADLADVVRVTDAVHAAGALVLWDLSHAVGAVPLDLDGAGVDFAVGCTYKYLNAGPGSPAFLYVRHEHQHVGTPIPGWFGHADQFAMERSYRPADGIARFLAGTPNIPGTVAVGAAVELVHEAGIDRLRAKSIAQTGLAIELAESAGLDVATPRRPEHRGSHIALRHHDAAARCAALQQRRVITDHRPPDIIRLGIAPLYTRFVDVWDAFEVISAR